MSQRSLQLSEIGQRQARQALVRHSLTQKALAEERHIASWSTINKFFNSKPVDRIIFQEICQVLGLEWEDVVKKQELGIRNEELGTGNEEPASSRSSFIIPNSSFPLPRSSFIIPNSSLSTLSAVQQSAADAREALTPRILERIPRKVVRKKYLSAIARSLEGQPRIIPIIAPAGCGKSTILGDLYDELMQTDTAWVGLVLCSTLSLSTAYMSFMSYGFVAGTFATQAYDPNQPSQMRQSMIDDAFGKGLCGQSRGIVDAIADLTQHHGRGVLLIDTLDLVINRDFVPAFRELLQQLMPHGVTVVFTCRDHDYNDQLEPVRERLPGLTRQIERFDVPNFTPAEIRLAASAFFRQRADDFPEPDISDRGTAFADNILALSADNRSLLEIIQNPLLLALLCDLFAQEGNVPPDLTVSKLYQRYWQEKVAYSRVDKSHFAPLALEKEKLCLTLAQTLFDRSSTRLCESIYRDEIGIEFTKLVNDAYQDLLSEGVIEHLPSHKLHFFHQTLLEYAIAYWLTRQSAETQRNQLLEQLQQPDSLRNSTYWLPVLRQLLTILEAEADFEALIAQLDLQNLGLFGAVAYAAASRDRPDALASLLPTALTLGEPHQRRLRQALAASPRQLIENTWHLFLTLLATAEHVAACNTAQMAGALLERWWQTLQGRLSETLAAIASRQPTARPQQRQQDDRAQLLGWLMQPCLPLIAQSPDPSILKALRDHIHLFGHGTCASIVQIHTNPAVTPAAQRALLSLLLQAPVPQYEDIKAALIEFIAALLPHHLENPQFPLGQSWSAVLNQSNPDGWDILQAKAVGRWAARDKATFLAILDDLLFGPVDHINPNLKALLESVYQGAGPWLVQHLLQLKPETPLAFKRFTSLLMRSTLATLTPTEQESLAQWLTPYAPQQINTLHPLLNALADTSSTARKALEDNSEGLSAQKQRQVRNQLLRFRPIQEHPPLASLSKTDQRYLVSIYQQQAATEPEALKRLLLAAQGRSQEVAIAASHNLDQVSDGQLTPDRLLPLLSSKFTGVRVNAVTALLNLSKADQSLPLESFETLCKSLCQESNQTVVRQLCELVTQWVKHHQTVPPTVLAALDNIPNRLAAEGGFEGGTGRALMAALKAMAQSGQPAVNAQRLSQLLHQLLLGINIIQIDNSEAEMIQIIAAIQRLNASFLLDAIATLCPQLMHQGWERNVAAIVRAIDNVEGSGSNLLDTILQQDWCTPGIESVVLEIRSGF